MMNYELFISIIRHYSPIPLGFPCKKKRVFKGLKEKNKVEIRERDKTTFNTLLVKKIRVSGS